MTLAITEFAFILPAIGKYLCSLTVGLTVLSITNVFHTRVEGPRAETLMPLDDLALRTGGQLAVLRM